MLNVILLLNHKLLYQLLYQLPHQLLYQLVYQLPYQHHLHLFEILFSIDHRK